jgi:plastocyanin
MDPEEIYQEVLKEEQQKGSAPPVAEGRAKAAKARAEAGSPHPKDPKWWPGSQPHLEGGDGGGEVAEEVEAEEVEAEPEEAPVAEAPAAPAEPAQPEVTAEQAEADATPQAVPVATAPAEAPAAAAPAAAVATAPAVAHPTPEQRPAGVAPGTSTGNRLRPEDGVSTEAQFEGQAAMYQRRKVIDELVATGVPAAAVTREDRGGSPLLALLYLIIPIVALVILSNLNIAAGEEEPGPGPGDPEGGITVVAQNVQFDTDVLELTADEEATITLNNEDSADHNIAIYEDDSAEAELFKGQIVPAGDSATYTVDPIEAGSYYFQCDLHPSMNGDAEVS